MSNSFKYNVMVVAGIVWGILAVVTKEPSYLVTANCFIIGSLIMTEIWHNK